MSSIRDTLWKYPDIFIPLVRRFSLIFTIIVGVSVGLIITIITSNIFILQKSYVFDTTLLKEGVIAEELQINPFDISDTRYDKELAGLIYSPLVTIDANGRLLPGLSESWSISEDGKSYTFYLRRNVQWHDGFTFTSEDVRSTFGLIKASGQSLLIGQIMKEVTLVVPNAYEVQFTLPQANASFLELLQIGIIPSHIYKNYSYAKFVSELQDFNPIGTGQFRFIQRSGENFTFKQFEKYYGRKGKIMTLIVTTFDTFDHAAVALRKGDIYSLYGISVSKVAEFEKYPSMIVEKKLIATNTRLIFFNLTGNKQTMSESIRKAITQSIDKLELVQFIPGAEIAYGPYSHSSWAYNSEIEQTYSYDPEEAQKLIQQDGWLKNTADNIYYKNEIPLQLSITYLNNETNTLIAGKIQGYSKQIGVRINLNPVTGNEIIQQILPQRDFEMLLFEIQNTIDPDIYTLWHSSQVKYPGLNISGYESRSLDGLLERARSISNRDRRLALYLQAQTNILDDEPVIFLYHPAVYTARFDIIDMPAEINSLPGQRFRNIADWVIEPRWRNWQTR